MKYRLLLSVICIIYTMALYAQTGKPVPLPDSVSEELPSGANVIADAPPGVLTPQMLYGRQLLYEENNEYISHEYHFASDGTVDEYNFDFDYEHNMRYLVGTVTRGYDDIFIMALKWEDENEDIQVIDHFRYSPLQDEIIRVY